jgi:hypothetical protein
MPFAAPELTSVRVVLGWKGARRHAGHHENGITFNPGLKAPTSLVSRTGAQERKLAYLALGAVLGLPQVLSMPWACAAPQSLAF